MSIEQTNLRKTLKNTKLSSFNDSFESYSHCQNLTRELLNEIDPKPQSKEEKEHEICFFDWTPSEITIK